MYFEVTFVNFTQQQSLLLHKLRRPSTDTVVSNWLLSLACKPINSSLLKTVFRLSSETILMRANYLISFTPDLQVTIHVKVRLRYRSISDWFESIFNIIPICAIAYNKSKVDWIHFMYGGKWQIMCQEGEPCKHMKQAWQVSQEGLDVSTLDPEQDWSTQHSFNGNF